MLVIPTALKKLQENKSEREKYICVWAKIYQCHEAKLRLYIARAQMCEHVVTWLLIR